jgi:hypothetical protein
MKKVLFILGLVVLGLANCNDDTPTQNFPACNSSTDPANEIAWIRQAIDSNQNLQENAQIVCYQLDGRLVFLVDYCVPCGDGYEVFDCEEQRVCADDENGNSDCSSFVSNATNEILIWRNF